MTLFSEWLSRVSLNEGARKDPSLLFCYISSSSGDVSVYFRNIHRVIIICVPSDFTNGVPLGGLRFINSIGSLLVVFISASALTPIFTCFA